MSKYSETLNGVTTKIKEANAARGRATVSTSTTDLNSLAHAMLNSVDHEVPVYNPRGDKAEPTVTQPTKRYRESLKPLVVSLGVDKLDADRVMEAPITKEHAAAMMEVSGAVMHDYIVAGRKYAFNVTAPDEAAMQIHAVTAPERESPNRFATGEPSITVTKERKILKASNKVPSWLKSKK